MPTSNELIDQSQLSRKSLKLLLYKINLLNQRAAAIERVLKSGI